ncbi:MAG TPA: hypothetical protein PLN56_10125 [Methanoregulaceae archaeon]|nr:hypothetical protein [Methanothrix sp.]HOL44413.1 hypothetical protein [Methanothrix sp.]HON93892.1 hypothetical protein [Sedimentisphaerales bacterium]HPD11332.1 hypothetical protein [Methanoregulaceae archaeon]
MLDMMEEREGKLRENLAVRIDTAYEQAQDLGSCSKTIYQLSQPIIKSMIRRYESLDSINETEDFLQQAYLAITQTILTYRKQTNSPTAKFSTVLYWQLQKEFESLCPSNHRQVELTYPDGRSAIISYKRFQKIKKQLPPGTQYTVSSRMTELADDRMYETTIED